MAIQVQRRTIPPAGIDVVNITLDETYEVEGIGTDTVTLTGELEAHRTVPLLGPGQTTATWETATIAANFVNLSLAGESAVFGPVRVTLDRSVPSMGVVQAGACAASVSLRVTMPQHDLVLRSSQPVLLRSQVETVPPIGNERTESVAAVALVDVQTNRPRGTLQRATVKWRELIHQKAFV